MNNFEQWDKQQCRKALLSRFHFNSQTLGLSPYLKVRITLYSIIPFGLRSASCLILWDTRAREIWPPTRKQTRGEKGENDFLSSFACNLPRVWQSYISLALLSLT